MMKEMMKLELANRYHANAFTNNYIFGWTEKGLVYMATVENCQNLASYIVLDKASRNGGYSIRFKPNRTVKEMLKFAKCEILCSKEYFEKTVKNSKYNRGEIFEKMVTEKFGQEWEKDNVPFTKDGDLTVNGKAYQIKFEKATFATEKQLMNLA